MKKKLFLVCLVLTLFLIHVFTAISQEKSVKSTEPLIELPKTNCTGYEDIEASAVEFIRGYDDLVIIAHDKCKDLVVVNIKTKEVVSYLKFDKVAGNPKWESMAQDAKDNYYVIGAYRDSAERYLVRFQITPKTKRKIITFETKNYDVLDGPEPSVLANYFDQNLQGQKIHIEGLAVKSEAGTTKLVIGLRLPSNPVRVIKADLKDVSGKPPVIEKVQNYFTFSAGDIDTVPFCLSSITYVSAWKGYLALTSAEKRDCSLPTSKPQKNVFQGNAMWFLTDADIQSHANSNQLVPAQNVWTFGIDKIIKAEGVTVFNDSETSADTLTVGIVFDNDRTKTGLFQKAILAIKPKQIPPSQNK